MELFVANILLVLFCTLMVTPAVATSTSSSQASMVSLGLQIPSFPFIALSLGLNVLGFLGLTPLAYNVFACSTTKLRIALVTMSLIEAGQAVCISVLVWLCNAREPGESAHWVYASLWLWPIPITTVVYAIINLRLYRLMCGSGFLKESKVPPILGGAIAVLIIVQAGANLAASVVLGASSQNNDRIASGIAMLVGGAIDAFISVVLFFILLWFLSLYHQWRAENFSGETQYEGEARRKKREQRTVAAVKQKMLGIAALHLVRVALLVIPHTLGIYFVLSCVSSKVYYLCLMRMWDPRSKDAPPRLTSEQLREVARHEVEMSRMESKWRNEANAKLSISDLAYHDFLNRSTNCEPATSETRLVGSDVSIAIDTDQQVSAEADNHQTQ